MKTWAELVESNAPSVPRAIVGPDGEVWTGDRLIRRARSASDWLDDLGIQHDTVVPALVATGPDAVALVLAGAATGRPIAPLGVRLTESEIAQILRVLPGGVLLAAPEFVDIATRTAKSAGKELQVIPLFEDVRAPLVHRPHSDGIAAVVHTSGTTGLPKPVPYRNEPLRHRVTMNATLMGLKANTAYATASPFHHIAGLGNVFVATGSGATLVSMPKFSVDEWQKLGDLGVTHAFAAPAMIEMLLTENALALPDLRLLQYGASAIRPETLRRAMEELPGVDFINFFGQTEGSPISVLTPSDHRLAVHGRPDLLTSVGRPPKGVEVVIQDPDPTGVGEIRVRANHVFRAEADGWLHTGDMGRFDADGYLYLTGRKGDLIIRGGENIYPVEVESVLMTHHQVRDAGVVARPDERLGEVPKAFIVPTDPQSPPDFEELRTHVRAELSGFKVPALWELATELPRDTSGKLLRRKLP